VFSDAFTNEFANQVAGIVLKKLERITAPAVAPRYLTVRQAAEYIGHTKPSFEYLMSKDLFPIIKKDRLVLIDREDLDKFMLRHKA
jgi:excisionase family DNA binding protein